jgi:predicted small metal-binding protein
MLFPLNLNGMKTMTCAQLGGARDEKFSANTFDEIVERSKNHAKKMMQKGAKLHLEAMNKMQGLMQSPASI